jgi:hypothetical protein
MIRLDSKQRNSPSRLYYPVYTSPWSPIALDFIYGALCLDLWKIAIFVYVRVRVFYFAAATPNTTTTTKQRIRSNYHRFYGQLVQCIRPHQIHIWYYPSSSPPWWWSSSFALAWNTKHYEDQILILHKSPAEEKDRSVPIIHWPTLNWCSCCVLLSYLLLPFTQYIQPIYPNWNPLPQSRLSTEEPDSCSPTFLIIRVFVPIV